MFKHLVGVILSSCLGIAAHAEIPAEKAHVEVLADHADKNWFWVWGNGAPATDKPFNRLKASIAPLIGHHPCAKIFDG